MKNLFLIIILIFLGNSNCQSQTVLNTDGLNNLDNVFLFSLKQYCNSLDSLKTKIVYVKRDNFVGESWPNKINSFEIKYLGDFDYKKIIQRNGDNITVVGIGSLEYRNDKFYVGVTPFSTSYSKKTVHFINGGGLIIYFEYDNTKKGLIYKTEEWIGI